MRAVIEHPVLKGGRQSVDAPASGTLDASAEVDREAGTLRITGFPPVSDRVATKLGRIKATVELGDEPAGTFDDGTGHVSFETTLDVRPKSLLARDSTVTMTLASDASVDTDGLAATGDPPRRRRRPGAAGRAGPASRAARSPGARCGSSWTPTSSRSRPPSALSSRF